MRFTHRFARATLAVSIGLLAGCAGIDVPKLDAPVPTRWNHPVPQASAMPVDLRGWWRAFHDPALDALVDTALRDNLQAAEATERLLASRERFRSARVQYLPRLRAKTEDAIDPDASASFFVAGFDATWELNLFGRGTATNRQASGAVDASAAELQRIRVSLVGEVVRDWLELRAAQQREATLDAMRDLRQRLLQQAQVRVRLRLAAPQTESQAEADLAQAEAALAEPRGEIDRLSQQLAVLLGRNEPDPAWLKPAPVPSLGELRIDQAPADLLRTRPEIARAEAEVLRAAGDAGIARADLLPRLGLGGSLVWSTNLTTHRRTSDNALLSAGPAIDIPLFDWGAREAELRASKHDLKASVYAYRQAVLEGVAEVETSLGQLERQRERQDASKRAHAALARAEQASATRVQLHLAAPAEQIDSQLALAQASLALTEATAARDLAFVRLYKALGGAPLPDDAASAADVGKEPR
ncbi:TolC family protein [Dyella lutea]|uniref:TolC family protein n=1 Tax=Dyella lutea TaxID=2950441 RepID=A0ABT1FAQ4_9GAMM|nr:TolC family protein [Dyella lutea]MCP1374439.1 TolC family protein [Dyella lutea]